MAAPATQTRVQVTAFSLEDPADALAVVQAPVPTPGPGEALVKVLVRPVNPADVLSMMGVYAGWQPALPAVPGLEGVGVVAALGPAPPAPRPSLLARLLGRAPAAPAPPAVGTRVIALPWPAAEGEGTFQEYAVVPVGQLVPVLDAISNADAAQLIVNPVTVLGMLEELALPAGAWLLVTAASSALGTMMLKVCKKRGIKTVALVRRAALEAGARAAGADAVVVTGEGVDVPAAVKAATGGALCAAAVDAVAGEAQAGVTASVADGGEFSCFLELPGEAENSQPTNQPLTDNYPK
jgi:NADPH2:quinone reductase